MSSLAKPPATDTGYHRHLFKMLVLLAVIFAVVFCQPYVALALQEEEAVTRRALEESSLLQEDFAWIRSIEPLTNQARRRYERRPKIAMWRTSGDDGYFTYEVRGLSDRFGRMSSRREKYRVYYNHNGIDEIQIYLIERNPAEYRR